MDTVAALPEPANPERSGDAKPRGHAEWWSAGLPKGVEWDAGGVSHWPRPFLLGRQRLKRVSAVEGEARLRRTGLRANPMICSGLH